MREDDDRRPHRLAELEHRVAELEGLHVILHDTTPLGRALFRPGQPLRFVNQRMAEISGYTVEQIEAPHFDIMALFSEDGRRLVARNIERRLGGEKVPPYELELATGDGRSKWVEVYNSTVTLAGEQWFQVQLLDITARKQAEVELLKYEAALRQSQKLEAVGNLAAGVAHDFNNLLTIIAGSVELLRLGKGGDGEEELTEQILQAVQNGSDLTARLLAFSRRGPARERHQGGDPEGLGALDSAATYSDERNWSPL